MPNKPSKSRTKVKAAFHEIAENPPAILAKTRKKEGPVVANKQRIAIGLSKARAAGARIPSKSSGRGLLGR